MVGVPATPAISVTAESRSQTVSIAHLSATITLMYQQQTNRPIIVVDFSSDNQELEHPYCLNPYLDLRFNLKDANGRSLPEDSDAWQKVGDQITRQGTNTPCEVLPPSMGYESHVALLLVFPTAPPGKYTLYMWLAPRSRAERASLAPISVVLPQRLATVKPITDTSVDRTDVLALHLSTSKSTYRVGEPVMVRVDVKNITTQPISLFAVTPWIGVDLTITQAAVKVHPTYGRSLADFISIVPFRLSAGNTSTLHWEQDFNPMSRWGFSDLAIGRYTITVNADRLGGVWLSGPYSVSHQVQSNSVTIDVVNQ